MHANLWKSNEILRGTPCKMAASPLRSHEIPKDAPCKMHANLLKSNQIPRVTPCKMLANPPKSNEISRGTLCKMHANPKKSDDIPRGTTPCKMQANHLKSNEIPRGSRCNVDANPSKSNEILWPLAFEEACHHTCREPERCRTYSIDPRHGTQGVVHDKIYHTYNAIHTCVWKCALLCFAADPTSGLQRALSTRRNRELRCCRMRGSDPRHWVWGLTHDRIQHIYIPQMKTARQGRGSYFFSIVIPLVCQDSWVSAYIPKPRNLSPAANSLYVRIPGCQPRYLSLGT
jgi:hypothetical protein